MGASVREPDDSEPSKNEPPKNEPLKSESSKSGPLENEPLKRESLRSEPSRDGSLKRESLNRQSSKTEPSKNQPSKDEPKKVDGGPSGRATAAPEPPWKRQARRGVFEGDVAVVELRSRLALAPDRIPEPAAPNSTARTSGALLRTGGVLMAATAAGVIGYLWGFGLSTKSPQLEPATGQANVVPTMASPAANLKVSNLDSERRSGPAAAIGVAPVGARGAADDVTSVDAVQRPSPLATGPRSVVTSPPSRPPAPAEDPSEIAAKVKVGEELMANGDITAARMMFQRAAQAGDAAGAFALAETYDPLVLSRLRLRGGIAPDVALARSWYEKARDLGSVAAPDRIVRLTQLPQ